MTSREAGKYITISAWRTPGHYFRLRLIVLVIELTFLLPFLTWAFDQPALRPNLIQFEAAPLIFPANTALLPGPFPARAGW